MYYKIEIDSSLHNCNGAGLSEKHLLKLLYSGLLLAGISHVFVIFAKEINWDEFFFLYRVHEYVHGSLHKALQTFHVHGFSWLPLVSNNEISQIIFARCVMFVFQAALVFFIYAIAEKLFSRSAALFSILSYVSFTYVIWQGTSFRADPIAVFLLMASLYIIIVRPKSHLNAAAAGLLIALAGMITIKSIFFVPTIGLVYFAQIAASQNRRQLIKHAVMAVATAGVGLTVLYMLHKASLPSISTETIKGALAKSYLKFIIWDDLFPRRDYFIYSLAPNMCFWVFSALGFINAFSKEGNQSIGSVYVKITVMLALALPLLSLLFYRNAFPYYYVLIIASMSILCGSGWDFMMKIRWALPVWLIASAAVMFCSINLFGHGIQRSRSLSMASQKEVVAVIHKMFSEPVAYIDRCGMISSFPWSGFFMSTAGIEKYRKNNIPILAQNIREMQPKFMIANIAQLDFMKTSFNQEINQSYRLIKTDHNALKKNYIPFWGPIYVAGKQFSFHKKGQNIGFDILIEGYYSVSGSAPIEIGGKKILPGNEVYLERGSHYITAEIAPAYATLTWGRNLNKPKDPPPTAPLFRAF